MRFTAVFERTHPSSSAARPVSLTRGRAAVIVVLAYAAAVFGVKIFLSYIESVHGYDDARDQQMTLMFAAIMGGLALFSLYRILSRP